MPKTNFETKVALLLATGCGSGYFPGSPGTCGTATCLALWFLTLRPFWDNVAIQIAAVVLVTMVGFWSSWKALPVLSCRKAVKRTADPQWIVIDEWAGIVTALIGIPASNNSAVLLAFVFFRFFDILKPFPISRAEKVPGAAGIMLDDLVAGIFACLSTHLLRAFLPSLF